MADVINGHKYSVTAADLLSPRDRALRTVDTAIVDMNHALQVIGFTEIEAWTVSVATHDAIALVVSAQNRGKS